MYIFCSYVVEFERRKGTALISSIYGLADMAMVGITVRTALRQWL